MLALILGWLITSFLNGVFFFIVFLLLLYWFYLKDLPVNRQPIARPQFEDFNLASSLVDLIESEQNKNSNGQDCTGPIVAMNMLFQFLFQELKDTKAVRRYIIRKMTMEFKELLNTKAASKIIHKITARDFSLGTSFPVVHSLKLQSHQMDKSKKTIQEISLLIDVEYKNGFSISVDADLILGRSAYVHIKIASVKGKARLQFTRHPFTHWSFAFVEDPQIDFAASSHFDGRQIPQLTTLIENQLRRSIRRKHTLPNYKIRFKPFFESIFTHSLYKSHLDELLLREAEEEAEELASSSDDKQQQQQKPDESENNEKNSCDLAASTLSTNSNNSTNTTSSSSSAAAAASSTTAGSGSITAAESSKNIYRNSKLAALGLKTANKYSSLQYKKLCDKIGFDLTSVGQLTVRLKHCDRLPESLFSFILANQTQTPSPQIQQDNQLFVNTSNVNSESVGLIYLTVSIDESSMKELMDKQICKEKWPILEFELTKTAQTQNLGLAFNEIYFINRNEVYIQKIIPNSLASQIKNLKCFDIIHSFNQQRINSVKQLNKLISKVQLNMPLKFTVQRPCINQTDLNEQLSILPLLKKSSSNYGDISAALSSNNSSSSTGFGLPPNSSVSNNIQSLNLFQSTAPPPPPPPPASTTSSIYANTKQRFGKLEQKLKPFFTSTTPNITTQVGHSPQADSSESNRNSLSILDINTMSQSPSSSGISSLLTNSSAASTPANASTLNALPISASSSFIQPLTVVTHTASAHWLVDYYCSASECSSNEQLTDLDLIGLLTDSNENRSNYQSSLALDKLNFYFQKTRDIKLVRENLSKYNNAPIQIDETYLFDLNDKTKYLNIFLWTVQHTTRMTKMKNLLIGYATIPLHEINVDCWNTSKGETQSTIYFQPLEEVKASAISRTLKTNSLSEHPGFNPKISVGALTLNIAHKIDKKTPSTEIKKSSSNESVKSINSNLVDENANNTKQSEEKQNELEDKELAEIVSADLLDQNRLEMIYKEQELNPARTMPNNNNNNILNENEGEDHTFVSITSYDSLTCEFCQKKIWFKNAFKCVYCGYVIHMKCYEKVIGKSKCVSHRFSKDLDSSKQPQQQQDQQQIEDTYVNICATPSMQSSKFSQNDDRISLLSTDSAQSTSSTPRNLVSNFLTGIRQRRWNNNSNATTPSNELIKHQLSSSSLPSSSKTQNLISNSLNLIYSKTKNNTTANSLLTTIKKSRSKSPADSKADLNLSSSKSDGLTDSEEFKDMDPSEEKFFGIELYDELPLDERKLKYQETIQKYQSSIDMMTKLKHELEKELDILRQNIISKNETNRNSNLLIQKDRLKSQINHLEHQMKSVVFLLMQCQIGLENCSEQITNGQQKQVTATIAEEEAKTSEEEDVKPDSLTYLDTNTNNDASSMPNDDTKRPPSICISNESRSSNDLEADLDQSATLKRNLMNSNELKDS